MTNKPTPLAPVALLDANLVIAFLDRTHLHNRAAEMWFESWPLRIATCPISQGGFVRHFFRTAPNPNVTDAQAILSTLTSHPRHTFLPDDIPYHAIPTTGIIGHRQITDAYLVALAKHHHATLATFDRALAALYPETVTFVTAPASK